MVGGGGGGAAPPLGSEDLFFICLSAPPVNKSFPGACFKVSFPLFSTCPNDVSLSIWTNNIAKHKLLLIWQSPGSYNRIIGTTTGTPKSMKYLSSFRRSWKTFDKR